MRDVKQACLSFCIIVLGVSILGFSGCPTKKDEKVASHSAKKVSSPNHKQEKKHSSKKKYKDEVVVKKDSKKTKATKKPAQEVDDESNLNYSFDEDNLVFLDSLTTKKSAEAESVEDQIRALLEKLKTEDRLLSSSDDFDQPYQSITFGQGGTMIDGDQLNLVQSNIDSLQAAVKNGEKIIIRGHADILENADESMVASLAKKRAEAVKGELVKAGISASAIEVVSCGAREPLVFGFNSDKQEFENRANRRVEIWTT